MKLKFKTQAAPERMAPAFVKALASIVNCL